MATKTKKSVKQVEKKFDPLMEVLFQILPEMNTGDMENNEDYDTEKGFDEEDTTFIHSCVMRLISQATDGDEEFAWCRSEYSRRRRAPRSSAATRGPIRSPAPNSPAPTSRAN